MSLTHRLIKNNKLGRFRKERDLRQRDVAYLLSKSVKDINRWEQGTRTPTLKNAIKLSIALNCPIEVLYFDYYAHVRKEIKQKKKQIIRNI